MIEERWTRGCGSGIGYSGHTNAQDYKDEALMGAHP